MQPIINEHTIAGAILLLLAGVFALIVFILHRFFGGDEQLIRDVENAYANRFNNKSYLDVERPYVHPRKKETEHGRFKRGRVKQ